MMSLIAIAVGVVSYFAFLIFLIAVAKFTRWREPL